MIAQEVIRGSFPTDITNQPLDALYVYNTDILIGQRVGDVKEIAGPPSE